MKPSRDLSDLDNVLSLLEVDRSVGPLDFPAGTGTAAVLSAPRETGA